MGEKKAIENDAAHTIERMRAMAWPETSRHSMPVVAQMIEGWADEFEAYVWESVEARAAVVVKYESILGKVRVALREALDLFPSVQRQRAGSGPSEGAVQ